MPLVLATSLTSLTSVVSVYRLVLNRHVAYCECLNEAVESDPLRSTREDGYVRNSKGRRTGCASLPGPLSWLAGWVSLFPFRAT